MTWFSDKSVDAMSRIEKVISLTPYSWQEIVAMGVKYLADELDSDGVKFTVVSNGVRISIKCDEENQKEAEEFWRNHVHPNLQGDE